MRKEFVIVSALCLLAGCSQGEQAESNDDFAQRIGYKDASASPPEPVASTAVEAPPPAGASPLQLEQLGNIGGVDLGPRDGGCSFNQDGVELLLAGALDDPAKGGKAVVRVGGALLLLDSAPGGLAAIKSGTTFRGQGFSVQVTAQSGNATRRSASMVVTDAAGKSRAFNSGYWVCSG